MFSGITTEKTESATVCRVEVFSDELKSEIRKKLGAICHGKDKVDSGSIVATYRETLKIFLDRYSRKSKDLQKGMIGELLTHLLLLKAFPDHEPASSYLNLEEGSVKKGFDIIAFDKKCNDIKIVEVKAGEGTSKSSDSANKALLNTAKNDLKDRLNDTEINIWLNAISHANITLPKGKIKKEIDRILEECYLETSSGTQDSTSKCVILVSVLYKPCKYPVSIKAADDKAKQIIKENLFKEAIVFSIQKSTWLEIVKFLSEEAAE